MDEEQVNVVEAQLLTLLLERFADVFLAMECVPQLGHNYERVSVPYDGPGLYY